MPSGKRMSFSQKEIGRSNCLDPQNFYHMSKDDYVISAAAKVPNYIYSFNVLPVIRLCYDCNKRYYYNSVTHKVKWKGTRLSKIYLHLLKSADKKG